MGFDLDVTHRAVGAIRYEFDAHLFHGLEAIIPQVLQVFVRQIRTGFLQPRVLRFRQLQFPKVWRRT
jgi:hypothetical protein